VFSSFLGALRLFIHFVFVSLLVAEVLRVADGLLLVARLVVAGPVVAAEGLRLLLPQALRLLVVPVGDILDGEHGQLLRLLLLDGGLGLGGGLRSGLGLCLRRLLDLLLRRRRRSSSGRRGSLRRLERGDLLRRRHGGRDGRLRRGRRLGGRGRSLGGRGDDLLSLLDLVVDLCRLALRRLVVGLPLGDEGLVGGHVLGADALHDGELVALLRDALEGIGLGGLDVLDEGLPGERAGGGLALGLGLTVVRLRLLAGLGARLAALLADGSGDALVERQLLGE
jgi:hypothetical protein